MSKNIKLSVLITTMNGWIARVKKELLPQLKNVDEVIISHQIMDEKTSPEKESLGKNIKYVFMKDKWVSKNRNNALKYATGDICHICDDDLNFIEWFEDIIKNAYIENKSDLISFQANNPKWQKHFQVKEWKHNRFSVLKLWSWWVTFRRAILNEKNISFDENFWLGTKYPVWEENIFLMDSYKAWLDMIHIDKSIVIHPDESSWFDYKNREDLIVARIKLFKRLFWFMWWVLAVPYFSFLHYKFYKKYFSFWQFFSLSLKSLGNGN